jgi:cell division protein FtsQ
MKNKKLIVVACIILIFFLAFSAFKIFKVREIIIIGNKNLTEKQVITALGLNKGSSIIYPSSKTLYERLKKISWIKDAIIRKDLNGRITIQIKESTPVAIAMIDERSYLIDYEAQVLEDFTEKLTNSQIFLPVLKDIDPFKNRDTLQSAIDLLNFLNSRDLIEYHDELIITGNQPDSLSINVDNIKIIVGKGDLETKFAKYHTVTAEIQKRGLKISYIDLRFPDRVIVKPLE